MVRTIVGGIGREGGGHHFARLTKLPRRPALRPRPQEKESHPLVAKLCWLRGLLRGLLPCFRSRSHMRLGVWIRSVCSRRRSG